MADISSSIDELRSKLGTEFAPLVCEIEQGMIRRFVRAIDDPNPRWQDEERARKSEYGGIIAPPTFVLIIGFEQILEQILAAMPSATILHGGTELEYYQPVRPGDAVTATTKIANIREMPGKMGKTAFISFDITYKNQVEEIIAKCRQIVIVY